MGFRKHFSGYEEFFSLENSKPFFDNKNKYFLHLRRWPFKNWTRQKSFLEMSMIINSRVRKDYPKQCKRSLQRGLGNHRDF